MASAMGTANEGDVDGRLAQVATYLRRHGPGFAIEAAVNFALPVVIYDGAKAHYGEVGGLLASSIPPIVWSLIEFARRRRIDALSMLVLLGIVFSLLAFVGGGSVKLLELKEKLVTATIGMIFLGSAAIGRPLIYQLARATLARKSSTELAAFEALRDNDFFKRTMLIMTLVWGFGLVGEAALAAGLVMALSVHDYLIAAPVLGYGVSGGLALWTFWFRRRQQRIGRARRAAAEASLEGGPA